MMNDTCEIDYLLLHAGIAKILPLAKEDPFNSAVVTSTKPINIDDHIISTERTGFASHENKK